MSDGTCRRFPNLSFTAVRAKLCQNSTGITPTPTQIKREQGKHFLVCMTLAGAGTGLQSLVGLSGPVVRFHLAHGWWLLFLILLLGKFIRDDEAHGNLLCLPSLNFSFCNRHSSLSNFSPPFSFRLNKKSVVFDFFVGNVKTMSSVHDPGWCWDRPSEPCGA